MTNTSFSRLSCAVLAITALAFALPQSAFAHAHLKSASPAPNSVTAAPKALSLHFTEGVEPTFSGVIVSGPVAGNAKAPVVADKIALDPSDHSSVTVALPDTLKPGQYEVKWHAVATDGHKTEGDYTFGVK